MTNVTFVFLSAAAGAVTPGKRVRYRLGEGITGQVVQSGKPIVVPRVSREPAFLNRAAERPPVIDIAPVFEAAAAGPGRGAHPIAHDRDHVAVLDDVRLVEDAAVARDDLGAALLVEPRDRDRNQVVGRVDQALDRSAPRQVDQRPADVARQ